MLGDLVTPIPREHGFQGRLQKNTRRLLTGKGNRASLSVLYFDLSGGYMAIIYVKKDTINTCFYIQQAVHLRSVHLPAYMSYPVKNLWSRERQA